MINSTLENPTEQKALESLKRKLLQESLSKLITGERIRAERKVHSLVATGFSEEE